MPVHSEKADNVVNIANRIDYETAAIDAPRHSFTRNFGVDSCHISYKIGQLGSRQMIAVEPWLDGPCFQATNGRAQTCKLRRNLHPLVSPDFARQRMQSTFIGRPFGLLLDMPCYDVSPPLSSRKLAKEVDNNPSPDRETCFLLTSSIWRQRARTAVTWSRFATTARRERTCV